MLHGETQGVQTELIGVCPSRQVLLHRVPSRLYPVIQERQAVALEHARQGVLQAVQVLLERSAKVPVGHAAAKTQEVPLKNTEGLTVLRQDRQVVVELVQVLQGDEQASQTDAIETKPAGHWVRHEFPLYRLYPVKHD